MIQNSKHIDNNELVERYQQGESQALKVLIRRFHPDLKRVIRHHTRTDHPVEDIVQECWHDIIQKLDGDGLVLKISFDAWAVTVARHKAIDWIRQQQRLRKKKRNYRRQYEADKNIGSTTDEDDIVNTKLERVQDGINNLPPTQKIVLDMFYMENLSLKEISRVLDIPEGTVKSRLYHARENLKKQIKP